MTEQEEDEILLTALQTMGTESQLDMVIEECSELIIAIQHYRRKRCDWDKVAEELADVDLCVAQMVMLDTLAFGNWRQKKLERLESLLNDGKREV